MKFSDEELTNIADESLDYLERAIRELNDVKEYLDIKQELESIKIDLLEESDAYRKNYYKQIEEERNYENLEYQRSRL